MSNRTKYVATTGLMLALLILIQFSLRGFGQIITGSGVNFVLAITALYLGYSGSITIAILSPILAYALGIGPAFIVMVPCVIAGNLGYILPIIFFKSFLSKKLPKLGIPISIILASIIKFLILYILIVKLVLPSMGLPDQKRQILSASFSFPQLITALVGGFLATLINKKIKTKKTSAT